MDAPRRRAKTWKWALGVLGGVALVFGLVVWDLHRRGAERLERVVKTRGTELAQRYARRPSLFGDPEPGNAWDVYERAFAEALKVSADDIKVLQTAESLSGGPLDPSEAEAVYARNRPCVELVRQALRRERVWRDRSFYDMQECGNFDHTGAGWTHAILRLAARVAHSAGRDREALEHLAMELALLQDSRRGGYLEDRQFAYAEVGPLWTWRSVLEGHSLTAEGLERLCALLDRLWEARPGLIELVEVQYVRECEGLLKQLEKPADAYPYPVNARVVWSDLYSRTLLFCRAASELEGYLRHAREVELLPVHRRVLASEAGLPPPERRCVYSALVHMGTYYEPETRARMEWALARVAMAVAWHESEKGAYPAALADLVPRYVAQIPVCPYTGTPLRYDGKGKVWSPGLDRDDDGGRPALPEHLSVVRPPDGDAVWAVRRK